MTTPAASPNISSPGTQAVPRLCSPFLAGTGKLELDVGLDVLKLKQLPQSDVIAGVLGREDPEVLVIAPRRSSKTSSVQAVLLGRMMLRDRYAVLSSAQTGVVARTRFREMVDLLQYDPRWTIRLGAGHELLRYDPTGSTWLVLSPKGRAFRSFYADCVWLDEAQEHDPEESAEILSGARPTMDTCPAPQLIVSGTPIHRAGMLWDFHERGEAGAVGVVEYSAHEDDDPDDEAVLLRVHPGIGTLTTLQRMKERRKSLGRAAFSREYLCQFPTLEATRLVPPSAWSKGLLSKAPKRPTRFGLGFEVAPDGSTAAVVAAWRAGDTGLPHVELLAFSKGASWVPRFVEDIGRRYRVPITGDGVGQNLEVFEVLQRARPRPKTLPLSTRAMVAAFPGFLRDLQDGKIQHTEQPDLQAAVEVAASRKLINGARLWSREAMGSAGPPLIAANAALAAFDALPSKADTDVPIAL